MSDGQPGPYDTSLLGGPWYISARMDTWIEVPDSGGGCPNNAHNYATFRSSPVPVNQFDGRYLAGGKGIRATVSGTAPNRRLDLIFNLPDETLMDGKTCGRQGLTSGMGAGGQRVWAGMKGLTGELHFME